jgi:hypothetical protein
MPPTAALPPPESISATAEMAAARQRINRPNFIRDQITYPYFFVDKF